MKLIVLAGAKQGTEIPLKKDEFTIGRSSDCTLRAGSEAISRRHCLIRRVDGGMLVSDLGSRNGTYVNAERIAGEVQLRHGDLVRVGPLEFRFETSGELKSEKLPKVANVSTAVGRTAAKAASEAVGQETIEDDISRWLLGPDPGAQSMRETQTFRVDETRAIPPAKPAEVAEVAEEPAADSNDDAKKHVKGMFSHHAPQTKDSREAAMHILRDMTRRR